MNYKNKPINTNPFFRYPARFFKERTEEEKQSARQALDKARKHLEAKKIIRAKKRATEVLDELYTPEEQAERKIKLDQIPF